MAKGNFRIGYTYELRLVKPSFRIELQRLCEAFRELDQSSDDGKLADFIMRAMIAHDNLYNAGDDSSRQSPAGR